ncbi:hypothetical protein [Rhodococcus sp. P1Y]|uniref:hypothetical protein n=1 Tax=Rhodococcus sp. P1Y TaxID=1302308 RepID=UPI000EB42B79|nr:hypothetical protein [Rhodococcus sp. P1Y]AYJ48122.1 hypothetical protein D8W71_06985 [Rhodococcus sp. P1Y]
MNVEQWWPEITQESREWLVEHNGEPVDEGVRADILSITGGDTAPTWVVGEPMLTDRTVDWIEAVANDETPEF